VNALARWLMRNGFRKGILGSSRFWLVLFGIASILRLIERINSRENEVVFSQKLEVGESLVIAHGVEPGA